MNCSRHDDSKFSTCRETRQKKKKKTGSSGGAKTGIQQLTSSAVLVQHSCQVNYQAIPTGNWSTSNSCYTLRCWINTDGNIYKWRWACQLENKQMIRKLDSLTFPDLKKCLSCWKAYSRESIFCYGSYVFRHKATSIWFITTVLTSCLSRPISIK